MHVYFISFQTLPRKRKRGRKSLANRKAAMKAKLLEEDNEHKATIKKLKEKHDQEIADLTRFYRGKLNELKEKNGKLKIMVQEKTEANDNMISLMRQMTPASYSYKEYRQQRDLAEKKKF